MEDLGGHFGGHLESKICQICCRIWMCFRYVFLNGFMVVLGMFWQICWCQNDDEKTKGGFVEMFVLPK